MMHILIQEYGRYYFFQIKNLMKNEKSEDFHNLVGI